MQYEYVRYLNQSTTNYVVSRMVNAFIAKDSDKAYAFEVAFYCQNGGATTGANIKVYKPDFTTQTLVYLGQVSAGTNLRPSDLDTGQVQEQTQACEFEEYFVDVFPEYRVFAFDINSSVPFEADIVAAEEFTVDWGDGTITQYASGPQTITHTYDISTTYTVTLKSPDKAFLTLIDFVSQSDIFFNISDLPQGIERLRLFQISNTITGDIRYLPLSLIYFEVYGSNTISGNTQHIANHVLVNFIVSGNNTITGSLADFSSNMSTIEIRGGNTINGNLNQLSSGVTTLYVSGNNTITGDLVDLPASCNYLYITGTNTISGDLADLPTGFNTLYIYGNNTITGDLVDLPASLSALGVFGNNTITGNLVDLPANLVSCLVGGDNTVFGDLSDIPATLTRFEAIGDNTISDFSGTLGNTTLVNFESVPISGGLSTLEVDNLLIALSAITFIGSKLVTLTGSNAARSAASDAAVTSLEAQGVTVTVSP